MSRGGVTWEVGTHSESGRAPWEASVGPIASARGGVNSGDDILFVSRVRNGI